MSIRSMTGARPRGYAVAQMVEDGVIDGIQTLQDWSADDPDTWSDDILRLAGGGLKNIGYATELPGIKQALQLLDVPAYYGGKLGGRIAEAMGFDPRIGGAIGNIGGSLIGGGGLVKGVTKGTKLARTGIKGAQNFKRTAGSLLEGGITAHAGTGLNKATLSTAERGALIARRSKLYKPNLANKEFITKLESQSGEMFEWARTHKNRLDGYPGSRTIELPDGRIYKYEPSSKGGELKFSWKSQGAAKKATDKRNLSIQPDTNTLLNQFGGKQQIVDDYVRLNEMVVRKVRSGITAYNKANPNAPALSLEHVFDVQHYGRLGEATRFSGKGADELGNLTVLGLKENARTGALARRIDSGDALIDLIKKDKFIDYNQTTADFIKYRVAQKVNKWTKADWDEFIQTAIQNPEKNLHQILIKQIQGKKVKPTQFPDNIQRHIQRSQDIGITEPSWKSGSIDYTWRPQSNTGQIDIPPQSLKSFKGLRDEFFKQIEELPSGSVWELNPKFKDVKRRRIYARLFANDPRIVRNTDETLGWVLRVP